ncbi:hypothetical protein D9M70_606070 [compost metagenome]
MQGAFQCAPAGPGHEQGDGEYQAESGQQLLANAEVIEETLDRAVHGKRLALSWQGAAHRADKEVGQARASMV